MRFSILHSIADLHDADSAFCLCNIEFPFLRCVVREDLSQFLGCYKENIMRKNLFDIIILDCHEFLCLTKALVYSLYSFLQNIKITFILCDDAFPIPLVNKDGMCIACYFITTDSIHIGVNTFAISEAVFLECVSFPFGKRLYDFCLSAVLFFDVKGNRTFHTVQVIIQS